MKRDELTQWLNSNALQRSALSELESKQVIEAYGITTNRAILAAGREEAILAAEQIGYPVALKVDSYEILHKTELGGVELGLKNEEEVAAAFDRMMSKLEDYRHRESFRGIGVHAMEKGSFELIVGAKRDPIFGPVLLVGMGGVYAELLKDFQIRLAPLNKADFREMIQGLKMSPLLQGYRGKPKADLDSLESIVLKLSELMLENPTISELDLNPVMLGTEGEGYGAIVVDASIVLSQASIEEKGSQSAQGKDIREIAKLLNASSVAVVGASAEKKKVGGRLVDTLVTNQYKGDIYPINKKNAEISGLQSFPSLSEINRPVDVATLVIPPKAVLESVEECARIGIKNIVINSSGFSEAGEEGKRIQHELEKLAQENNLNIVGPNSQGIVNFNQNYFLSFSSVVNSPRRIPGDVCLITQSGAIGSAVLTRGWEVGLGFSHFISTGNEACMGIPEFISCAADDPAVKVIAVFMEGLSSWDSFSEAALKAQKNGKPIVVYKTGRSEVAKKAIGSHTGSLAGEDSVYDVAFQKAGIIRVTDIASLIDTCLALSWLPRYPEGRNVGIISTSGGACGMLADESEQYHIQIPEFTDESLVRIADKIPSFGSPQNPIDLTAQVLADNRPFQEVLSIVANDPKLDSLILMLTTSVEPGGLELAKAVLEIKEELPVPLFICRMASDESAPNALKLYRESRIPVYPTPDRLMKTLNNINLYLEMNKGKGNQ